MTSSISTRIIGAVVVALALAACGSDADPAPPTSEVLAATTTAEAAVPAVSPPKPDEATAAAYLAALQAIDPAIVGDKPERAIDRGRAQCDTITKYPADTTKQTENAQVRFTSPQHPNGFGPEKSARINGVVKQYICP